MWKDQESSAGQSESPGASAQIATRKRNLWRRTEVLLLVVGLALLAVYTLARIESIVGSRAALEIFSAIDLSVAKSGSGSEGGLPAPQFRDTNRDSPDVDFSLWDERRVQAYKQSLPGSSVVPIGVLRISKIHLEVPVFDGTDDLTLNHAVGRIAGTARPAEEGNVGIAGHRDGFFRGLKDVNRGDAIELKTLQGTKTYLVDEILIVTPDDVSVLEPRTVPSLTLVTCYPFYFIGSAPQRYVVMASLAREIRSGPGNLASGLLSQTRSSKRRNNEQPQ